ncbi:MAG: NAD(P)H-dependent glycerol-3-phosphate dehydrogenase [Sulfurimonas sp.]|nr:MAG: NAD(P)H-dependent glycerol-3-phosphate dehydrogenase [Sulfurimonas sp.]
MSDIAVIGAGKWGYALYRAIRHNHNAVITSRTVRDMEGFVSLETALACRYLVFAIPAQEVGRWLCEHFVYKEQKVLVAAKGIEAESGRFLNEIFETCIPSENLAYLSGPSFAAEVMQSLPTAVVINSYNHSLAETFGTFFPDFMKTYYSTDVIGAEVCGAYKNVIAIAAGICEGLHLGNNAAASLIARGLVEMQRFGKSYGARDESFIGLSGAGDLFLTASSTMSRNFRVGLGMAKGQSQELILQELAEVAEGIGTAYALQKIAQEKELYLPIAREVYNMLEGKDPQDSLRDLLSQ